MGNQIADANLVYPRMLHLQATCEIQLQRQEVYCAYLHHTRLSQFRGCARSKPAVSHSSAESEIVTLQLFNFWNVSWKQYPARQPRETLSVTHAKESFRLTHILTIVFLSPLATYHPTFSTVHSQPNSTYVFEDNAAVIQMISKGRSPNARHTTRTHRGRLDFF